MQRRWKDGDAPKSERVQRGPGVDSSLSAATTKRIGRTV